MAPDRAEPLPSEFPIFPLEGAVLLPGGKLPLNIFERRYLAMVDDVLGSGRVIGMVQPEAGRPATPNGPGLYRIGCLGRLSSFSETEDGRYLITLTGVTRFAVAAELEVRRGYRVVRADLAPFGADLHPAEARLERGPLTGALRAYFAVRGLDANWDAIEEMPDAMLVTTLSMICPFDPPEKQALLEAPGPAERAHTLLALLQMGAHAAEAGRSGRPVS